MSKDSLPSNNISFIAAAVLTGKVQVSRVSQFDFELSPMATGIQLWRDFQEDQLVFSARLIAEQIAELKKLPYQI